MGRHPIKLVEKQVAALWHQGFADYVIAKKLGCSTSVVARTRRTLGLAADGPRPETVKILESLKPFFEKGFTDGEVAEDTGLSHRRVADLRRMLGLKPNVRLRQFNQKLKRIRGLLDQGRSQSDVARVIGITRQAVNWYLKQGARRAKGKDRSHGDEDEVAATR